LQAKTRNSKDYHAHINEVNHTSVQEHMVFTMKFPGNTHLEWFINRPGMYLYPTSSALFVTMNMRACREYSINGFYNPTIGALIEQAGSFLAPLSMGKNLTITQEAIDAITDNKFKPAHQYFQSFYIDGISRGLSHELIRHKYETAVSQRSTRYVDESESEWAWHPLIQKYWSEVSKISDLPENQLTIMHQNTIGNYQEYSSALYENCVKFLQEAMISSGIDKFSARKQARGAARGILGNALSTELVFTASLNQWLWMIASRCNDGADAEIRLLHSKILDYFLTSKFKEFFKASITDVRPAFDGFGYHVTTIARSPN
jgi:flavin-dependent thymidylate synthase